MDLAREYDLVIIGGGTGGYVAAIRAAQLGLQTAIVEKEKLGGTCLHKGCIPTKTFLRTAEMYRNMRKANEFGIECSNIHFNFKSLQKRKEEIIHQLHKGIQGLIRKGKIDCFYGKARLLGPSIFSPLAGGTISIEMNDASENEMLIPKNVLIATGSKPRELEDLPVDGEKIMNSDQLLEMEELPSSILIVGGGVIGIEWASCLKDLGVEVTVIENGKRILPSEDEAISKEMLKQLRNRGINVYINTEIISSSITSNNGLLNLSVLINGEKKQLEVEKILISVGRVGNIQDLGLENTEIEIDSSFIKVNDAYQTKERHIYAIGDCIGGMQLAHVASHEGIRAVEHIATGKKNPLKEEQVPRCVYAHPEIASVGLTEEKARSLGYNIKTGIFPFKGVGKAIVFGESEGFVKIIADCSTDDLLGVHIIGPHATDMISEAALGLLLQATPWEISETIHPHPTLSESLSEAALRVYDRAIHF